mmetsp:Transcript_29177/g.48223  ORF Transcript_29177/g.48223 Transcript_29177/m.48223 type:complete len:292 (-) Transcript_29177:1058-1933(-)|eukprot:CAMPEP_0119012140 /NCGR_PEP_ID=MMETSP1176-20130426/6100_1 /TAXON_ID=265551 /ORGANISM="Synedropsis recta cf, Strain CCMP1620" /LENGTH=291 /DNA_ID=CAMNT_0006965051 /DNA_START=93 /DNA_END=968 /DNA_ORIENTATION=+
MATSSKEVQQSSVGGAIVVVAKCPLPGKSKTRLIPMLGEEGSAQLAKAMLSDVLCSLVHHEPLHRICKILYYAPGTEDGRQHMQALLKELAIADSIQLIPMLHGDLHARDLGNQLQNALTEAKKLTSGPVMFLGMDSPELPLDEVQEAFSFADHATLCPSQDGGYGMLTVPNLTPPTVFENVLWSHPLTAVSQLKVLSDAHIPIRMGRIMHDMDEPEDVQVLFRSLLPNSATSDEGIRVQAEPAQDFKSLQVPSSNASTVVNGEYPFTKKALQDLKELISNYDSAKAKAKI